MIRRTLIIGAAAALYALMTGCTHGKKAPSACLCLVGGDTVSLAKIRELVPDSLPFTASVMRAARELAFAKAAFGEDPKRISGRIDRERVEDLARQLSRRSDKAWSVSAVQHLCDAVQTIADKQRQNGSLLSVLTYSDSLFSSLVVINDTILKKDLDLKKATSFDTSVCRTGHSCLEPLISFLFFLPLPESRLICEFVDTVDNRQGALSGALSSAPVNVSSKIKGLVFDSARPLQKLQARPHRPARTPAVIRNNSQACLRFRSQQSIKDSIEKHVPDLEALYKKHLKAHQTMKGVVQVLMQINPDGRVIHTRIKTSAISEKDFLDPLCDYILKKIRFQRIPEKTGDMLVEFPFEFSPQN